MTTTLGMFAKFPEAGCVKTRLAKHIGNAAAARLYEAFLRDLAVRFCDAADRRVLAFAPDSDAARQFFSPFLRSEDVLWAQPQGSLADRMESFFQSFGPTSVVLIGSDSPTLPRAFVDEAFHELERHDVVLGPATDGGLYLIGLNGQRTIDAVPKVWPIFQGIDWSTSQVLEQVSRKLSDAQGTLHLLPPWYDVDDVDDLNFLRGHLRTQRMAANSVVDAAPFTQAVLADIERGGSL